MELRSSRKKPTVQLRYYELPEREPVLALMGPEWVRVYGNEPENLHFHNLMEIGVCRWGEGEMEIDGQSFSYKDGMITIIPANCLHSTVSRDGGLNQWEYLFTNPEQVLTHAFPEDPVFVEGVLHRLQQRSCWMPLPEGGPLRGLIDQLLDEYRSERPYHHQVVEGMLTALLLLVARMSEQEPRQQELPVAAELRQIMPALEYIGRNYMNPITVQELAAQCSLSEAHLRRKFKEYLNMSPGEYLTAVRIRQSCELLNTTRCSMMEVALRVGYQSVSSFDRNFQRLMGMTPYQYKKNGKNYQGKLLNYKIAAKKGWKTREDV